jgi:acetate kinase
VRTAGDSVLTLNAGSSSLKYALFAGAARVASGSVGRLAADPAAHEVALSRVLADLAAHGHVAHVAHVADVAHAAHVAPFAAVGHRVVHGGDRFVAPTRVDDAVVGELRRLAAIDPDHLPAEIAVIEAMRARAPGTPQVACFDTAFHARMPRVSTLLPLPRRLLDAGVRRYGFHGLSYEYLLAQLGDAARGRVVLAHLGAGASLCAVRDGAPIDTTMGFTPTGGIPMATRTGDLDPGVLVHLMRVEGASADAIDDLVNRRAGMLGVSGTNGDMRDLLAREAADPAAADAVALFVHGVRKAVGALAATIDGLDTLVFSAGIGENAPAIRARVCAGLAHLGVALDDARNAAGAPVISADASRCSVRVIRTDEEAVIARHTRRLLEEGEP